MDFVRSIGFSIVDADIDRVRVFCSHLPEGIFNDSGRVHADTKIQKQNLQIPVSAEELRITLRRDMPVLILDKGSVRPIAITSSSSSNAKKSHRSPSQKFLNMLHTSCFLYLVRIYGTIPKKISKIDIYYPNM